MARKAGRRQRDRLIEQATLERAPRDLREARRVFREELDVARQHALVREIVETRGAELCRAYRNVLNLGYGHRQKTDRRSGSIRVTHEPCVTFVVKRKWARGEQPSRDEPLPGELLAYCEVGGRRRLCAVPTDVDQVDAYAAGVEQVAAAQIQVDQNRAELPLGMIACALRRSLLPDKIYVLGCRHVFAGNGGPTSRAKVELEADGALIGVTRPLLGKLESGLRFSLDAQLAELQVTAPALAALGPTRLTGFADAELPLPDRCFVLTSRGPIPVQVAKVLRNHVLPYSGGRLIVHDELLVSRFAGLERTRAGDSGSPLVSGPDGGVLLGMHIAGTDEKAFAVPAWDLFSPALYSGAIRSERWQLVQPEELGDGVASPAATRPAPQPAAEESAASGSPISNVPAHAIAGIELLQLNHNFNGGVRWKLSRRGIHIENAAPRGRPRSGLSTVGRVWRDYGDSILRWSEVHDVPVELIVATICTESSGKAAAIREEPGYVSDSSTPMKVSVGLMQTLIGTAREALGRPSISRADLLRADTSIEAGTAYIAKQGRVTHFDPPKVACAYNAGGIYPNNGRANRWKMKQYRIDTGEHADRFVAWFNDCCRYFAETGQAPARSFCTALRD